MPVQRSTISTRERVSQLTIDCVNTPNFVGVVKIDENKFKLVHFNDELSFECELKVDQNGKLQWHGMDQTFITLIESRFNKEFQKSQPIFVLRSIILDYKEGILGFRPPDEIERLCDLSVNITREDPNKFYTEFI